VEAVDKLMADTDGGREEIDPAPLPDTIEQFLAEVAQHPANDERDWDYERFMLDVDEPDMNGCRRWLGDYWPSGYGLFKAGGKSWGAHRWLLIHRNGGINPGRQIHACHSCWEHGASQNNKWCVAVEHLRFATAAENIRDAYLDLSHISVLRRIESGTFDWDAWEAANRQDRDSSEGAQPGCRPAGEIPESPC
jgi:hypothetical protein